LGKRLVSHIATLRGEEWGGGEWVDDEWGGGEWGGDQ
jgi:hypothetical protein